MVKDKLLTEKLKLLVVVLGTIIQSKQGLGEMGNSQLALLGIIIQKSSYTENEGIFLNRLKQEYIEDVKTFYNRINKKK